MAEIQQNNPRKLESETEECSEGLELAAVRSMELDQNNGIIKPAQEVQAVELEDKGSKILVFDDQAKILELDKEAENVELGNEAKILELEKEVEIELTREMPTLVLELFLEWLKDVKLLKTCRLVNQYWNSLACASLGKHSIVNLREEDLCRFKNCQSSRAKIGNRVATPCPFQNFHVWTSGFKNDDFYDLARRNKNKFTSVTLEHDMPAENHQLENLNKFLREVSKNLSTLRIEDDRNETFEKALRDVKLPVLTNLNIEQSCLEDSSCNHIEALLKSLEYSCLQRLTLYLSVSSKSLCIPSLLKINLSQVVELNLKILDSGKNEYFWKLLPQLKLPSLKIFEFKYVRVLDEDVQPVVTAFLSNVALTLVRLNIIDVIKHPQWTIRIREIDYPNLKVLDVLCPADLYGCFTVERFPSLQTLSFIVTKVEQLEFPTNGHDILGGVWKLKIFIDTKNPEGLDRLFSPWLADLTRRFPNVAYFVLIDRKKKLSFSFPLLDSLQVYSNLKVLHVEADIDFMALYGTSLNDVPEYNASGQLQELPERSSLLNFKNLEVLVLAGGSPQMSNDTFMFCLANLTTLKYLEFPWSPQLSPKTVATYIKYIRGLKRMEIHFPTGSYSRTTQKEIEEAFEGREDLTIGYAWRGRVNPYKTF